MTSYGPGQYGDIQRTVEGHHYSHESGGDDVVKLSKWEIMDVGDIIITTVMPVPIPAGWQLVAQDRFLMGAGTTYDPADTGGSDDYTHDDAPNHAHGGAYAHSGGAVADHPGHTHPNSTNTANIADTGSGTVVLIELDVDANSAQNHVVTQPAAHTITNDGSHGIEHGQHDVPPFYAAYFFLRVY